MRAPGPWASRLLGSRCPAPQCHVPSPQSHPSPPSSPDGRSTCSAPCAPAPCLAQPLLQLPLGASCKCPRSTLGILSLLWSCAYDRGPLADRTSLSGQVAIIFKSLWYPGTGKRFGKNLENSTDFILLKSLAGCPRHSQLASAGDKLSHRPYLKCICSSLFHTDGFITPIRRAEAVTAPGNNISRRLYCARVCRA